MRIEWIHIRNFRFIRDLEIRDIENALILKYYSFENYFLDPKVMAKIGVVQSEEAFYETLFEKWQDYLHRLRSGRHLTEVIGHSLSSVEDVKAHMEEIGCPLSIGVGGTFDVMAGVMKRAPLWMQKAKLEWLFRGMLQPKRIGRLMALPRFVFAVKAYKKMVNKKALNG